MKTVIEMARIAGARDDGSRFEFELRDLEFLVALVRFDEREVCAYKAGIAVLGADRGLANRVDQAIRARSNT